MDLIQKAGLLDLLGLFGLVVSLLPLLREERLHDHKLGALFTVLLPAIQARPSRLVQRLSGVSCC